MQHFVIYNPTTGDILRSGFCPDKMVGLQVREGESVMVGQGHDIDDKITVDGAGIKTITRRADTEIAARRTASGFPVEAAAATYRTKGFSPALALRLAQKTARKVPTPVRVTPATP